MEPITLMLSIFFSPPISEHAYLDPGSGSFILQIILATFIGGLFIVKSYWQKIRRFIRSKFTKGEDGEQE